jgi:protein SCO1/2|tara:strand:- start:10593 stop:11195 length:603 start_codon:yes stop_codon:yes gene_type:complete
LKTVRLTLWGAVVVASAAFLWLYTSQGSNQRFVSELSQNTDTLRPEFSLTDHQGNAVTEQTYRGKWLLVFFGFTNCPDICPTTLGELAQLMDLLGPDAQKTQPLFISIDPERDRVETMAEYVSAFHPSIVGLTGTETEVTATAKSFKAFFEKLPQETAPDGYTMGHTSAVYLISPEGVFVRTYSYGTSPEKIAADVQQRL